MLEGQRPYDFQLLEEFINRFPLENCTENILMETV